MLLEWSRQLLQKSDMGKYLPLPTTNSAVKDEKKRLKYRVKFSASGMNTEVEGKIQSLKRAIKVSPSFFFL